MVVVGVGMSVLPSVRLFRVFFLISDSLRAVVRGSVECDGWLVVLSAECCHHSQNTRAHADTQHELFAVCSLHPNIHHGEPHHAGPV